MLCFSGDRRQHRCGGFNKLKTDIKHGRRMRQSSHGNVIDASAANFENIIERYVARRLEFGSSATDSDSLAHRFDRHIIEQNPLNSEPECLSNVVERASFHFNFELRSRRASTSTAAVIEPAKSMWLSFINTMSKRPVRWFCPPPSRTASLSVILRPGAVLRVSRMIACVVETASTNLRVKVAIPDMRPRKFRAVRSPVRSARAGPSTSARTVRLVTFDPSSTFARNSTLSFKASITCFATISPATTPSCLATIRPRSDAFAGTIVSVVTSPVPISSSSARLCTGRFRQAVLSSFSPHILQHYLTVIKTSRPSWASFPEKSVATIRST